MDSQADKRRWYLPTPAWLVWGAVAASVILFAAERWRWLPVHYQKGWPVLLAVAVMGTVFLVTMVWMLMAILMRRRVQFGLRTLLVFVTLCAVVCSWMAVRIKQARRQAEVAAAIRDNLSGILYYDWQYEEAAAKDACHLSLFGMYGITSTPSKVPPFYNPLGDLLGVDFFHDIDHLAVINSAPTDETLQDVAAFAGLRVLHIKSAKITDAGLLYLEGLTNLQDLMLSQTKVTDAGVKRLRHALPKCLIWGNPRIGK